MDKLLCIECVESELERITVRGLPGDVGLRCNTCVARKVLPQ